MTPSRTHLRIAEAHQVEVQTAIDRFGFHATHVLGDQFHPPFSSTTGLLIAGHPELVILGLAPVHCLELFAHVTAEVHRGATLPVGRDTDNEMHGIPFRLLPVPAEHWTGRDCLLPGFASFYRRKRLRLSDTAFLQLVWPDEELRFPWDDGAAPTLVRDQRVLADGDPPTRRQPLAKPIDNRARCSVCSAEPRNRAERRHQARRR